MNDWFEWNGVRCTEYGIHVSEQPPITRAKERITYVEVPGRSGSLEQVQDIAVYDDVTLTLTCWIADDALIDAIGAWLQGSGYVRFANRSEGIYEARVANQIAFEKILRGNPHRSFTVQFRCRPFLRIDTTDSIECTEAAATKITNDYGFDAQPLITVYGAGSDINLMIGRFTVFIDGLEDNITIDCEAMMAYRTMANGSFENAGSCVTLEDDNWPMLESGSNTINWSPTSGKISKVIIEPRWRCL